MGEATDADLERQAEQMAREFAQRGIAVLMLHGLWVEPRGAAEFLSLSVGYLKNLRSYADADRQPPFCVYARRVWYSCAGLLTWKANQHSHDFEVMDTADAARAMCPRRPVHSHDEVCDDDRREP